MIKEHSPVKSVSFRIVLALVVGLLWLASHLERASF
jgi:hypothetical protein